MELRKLVLGMFAYLVPTFAIAYVWHLQLFASYYDELAIYRADKIIPFGFASILLQGVIFSTVYGRLFDRTRLVGSGLRFAALAGLLSWSFTTLAVAAKHHMTSVPGFMLIETAFTAVQFLVVGPLMALAWRDPSAVVLDAERGTTHGV
jgi:hypothetical protein